MRVGGGSKNVHVVVECPLKGAGKILLRFKRELENFCEKKMWIRNSLKHVTNMLVVIVDCSVVEFILNKIRPTSALLI